MIRKDCEQTSRTTARARADTSSFPRMAAWLALVGAVACVPEAHAGTIRVWPTAVVVADSIRLDDLCELRGFDYETELRIAGTIIAEAPSPGGSRAIHLPMIRDALIAQGVNQAGITLSGAVRCDVTRPAAGNPPDSIKTPLHSGSASVSSASNRDAANADQDVVQSNLTLRRAIIDYFNDELARYRGSADVVFDRTSEQMLDLSGPSFTFRVRRQKSTPLGLIPVEVDVITEGRVLQSVPLVVNVALIRLTVVAKRAINQSATIQSSDVEVMPMRYTVLNQLGLDDTARAIGQRAKRMIQAGSIVEPDMLETVPLVVRGQLISITAVSGGVHVVTTGKAAQDGLLGETVKVRAADNRRIEFDAIVIGPGRVQVGGTIRASLRDLVARSDGS
jgi:flagella basal body P-ring formation protein FlgA